MSPGSWMGEPGPDVPGKRSGEPSPLQGYPWGQKLLRRESEGSFLKKMTTADVPFEISFYVRGCFCLPWGSGLQPEHAVMGQVKLCPHRMGTSLVRSFLLGCVCV